MSSSVLLLFDIDGTLGGHPIEGVDAFKLAYKEVFSREFPASLGSFAGKTDLGILQEVGLAHGGAVDQSRIEVFFSAYHRIYSDRIKASPFILFEGAVDLIERLFCQKGIELGLVTGNIQRCARLKLSSGPIDHCFEFGGFGDEHHCRNELAKLAFSRALKRLERRTHYEKVILVGDTPKDIEAAKAIEATSIGYVNQRYDEDALLQSGADQLVRSIRDLETVLGSWI